MNENYDEKKLDDLFNRANDFHNSSEYQSAIDLLDQYLSVREYDVAFYLRAFCFLETGDSKKALSDFSSAENINDKDARYPTAKALTHTKLNQYEDAISSYNKVIALNPSVFSYSNRAILHREMGDYESALNDYSEAIKLDSGKGSLYVSRSSIYKRMGDLDSVWENLEKAVEVEPDNLSTYLDALEMYITTESYREGFAYIEKHGDHVLSIGNNRYKLLFLYLKATVFICLNMGIESFEDEIKKIAKEGLDLEWYFGHTRNWLEESELMQDKKDKIEELTDLVEL
ncbi:MAG: tetratricopeptide repeat protein [Desulfobacterales bacterium]|nr:tetratricopeptide repeat protein [Desulfobacterales bacterium]MCP4163122.1 tetratricopeptide repeat protein [Deltaproteobacteria bacterium]